MAKSPTAVAQKWATNLSNAGDSIRAGVQAVTTSPTDSAARRADAYVAGVNRAVQEGRWQRGLQRVTLQDWQTSMIDKGLPRIAGGAAAAKPKMENFLTEFLPFADSVVARVNQEMPRGDIEQNIARATAVMRGLAEFRKRQ